MRAIEFLIEGSGLRAAKPGEVYVSDDGTEYQFQSWNWQHPSDALGYEDMSQLEQGVLDATSQDKEKIVWINAPTNRSKSFAYAIFKSNELDQELWLGKFYNAKNPNNTILDKEVKQFLGLSAGGKSSAIKATAAVQPGDFGLADNRARNLGSLIKAVSGHDQGPMLSSALSDAGQGQAIIFEGGAPIAGALQDNFCEIVAPVAIMTGNPLVKGQHDKAIADVFKGIDISDAAVTFPVEQNSPLIDSYILKDGITLGVSSKGKQGAKATITNIWKAKEEAALNPNGAKYIKQFPEAVAILDICRNESGLEQPIILAERYSLINEQEATALREAIQTPRDPKYQLVGNPQNPTAVIKNHLPEDLKKVPKELMRLFRLGGYKSGSYVSFLCLARVAHLVKEHINTDPEIDFGEAIRSFLNSSAMVQAKTVVGVNGDNAVVKSISVVYPPNFQDKATIEANGYSGTQVKGKFSFQLPTT